MKIQLFLIVAIALLLISGCVQHDISDIGDEQDTDGSVAEVEEMLESDLLDEESEIEIGDMV